MGKAVHQHIEQFNQQGVDQISPAALGMKNPYRKLVAIRSTQNLFMLEKTLAETDPETTDVAVMTAHVTPRGDTSTMRIELDQYDRRLMTAVVDRAEKAGKHVTPLIVPTNNALYAIVQTAHNLRAQELVMGGSNTYTADEQLEQAAFYWIEMHGGVPQPLTIRLLSRNRDLYLDLGGGSRIPKISERKARSVAELRSAGVGVEHVLLVHYGTPESSDLFEAALTMLDPAVSLCVVPLGNSKSEAPDGFSWVQHDLHRARQLRRDVELQSLPDGNPAMGIVQLAGTEQVDLLVLGYAPESAQYDAPPVDIDYIVEHAPCRGVPRFRGRQCPPTWKRNSPPITRSGGSRSHRNLFVGAAHGLS